MTIKTLLPLSRTLAAGLLLTPAVLAQDIEVLYSKVDASATSDTPWTLDAAGMPAPSKFRSIDDFAVSHDGSRWVLKAANRLGSDLQNMLVLGDAAADPQTAINLAQEGQPVPTEGPGITWDFFDSGRPVSFDSSNNIGMSGRSAGPPVGQRERIMKRDTLGNWTIVLREGDPLMGLTDTPVANAGDEALGNSVSGVHLLDDGRIGYIVTPIQNCSSFNYPAFLYDDTGFLQTGASTLVGGEVWDGMDLGDSGGTPDGNFYYIQGDTENPNTSIDDVLTVNNAVVLREGDVLGGVITLTAIFETEMAASGDWISRGDDPLNDDWVVLNGNLLFRTGDSVEGGAESWGASIAAIAVNSNGDWAAIGNTDNVDDTQDEVLVVNGLVIAREGDPIDLDGNGSFDDGAFLGDGTPTSSAFAPNDLAITDSGMVYFIGRLNDGMGNDLNDSGFSSPDAFLRMQAPNISAPVAFCFGDGSAGPCPCGNESGVSDEEGCENSQGHGATLAFSGTAIVANDNAVFSFAQARPNQPGLLVQGANLQSVPFKDGLLCLAPPTERVEVIFTDASGEGSSASSIVTNGNVSSGDTRYYQYWYRDPSLSPCGTGSNFSHGIQVDWI